MLHIIYIQLQADRQNFFIILLLIRKFLTINEFFVRNYQLNLVILNISV